MTCAHSSLLTQLSIINHVLLGVLYTPCEVDIENVKNNRRGEHSPLMSREENMKREKWCSKAYSGRSETTKNWNEVNCNEFTVGSYFRSTIGERCHWSTAYWEPKKPNSEWGAFPLAALRYLAFFCEFWRIGAPSPDHWFEQLNTDSNTNNMVYQLTFRCRAVSFLFDIFTLVMTFIKLPSYSKMALYRTSCWANFKSGTRVSKNNDFIIGKYDSINTCLESH